MPMKRRIDKSREPTISPQAVELFARAKKLLRRRHSEQTENELSDISFALAVELKQLPWMTDVLDTLGFSKPPEWEDANDPDWHRSAAIAAELETVLRAKRDAEREARRAAQPSPPPAPVV
jgi:hypothetical protein